ncbi:MAG: hypothetical protein HY673_17440 [Chloroflexi bacterium]|nr:hypothetical protein [Chloroflexota bacterium]
MKKWTIVIIVFAVVFAAGLAIGYMKGRSPAPGGPATPVASPPPRLTPTPAPIPTASPAATPARTPLPTPVGTPGRPPVVTPTPAVPPPVSKGVSFSFAVTGITGTGLTRTVTALLRNTGTADAHNAWAKVEVFSQGARVSLSGSDFIRVDIGTLRAGESVSKQVDITFNVFDGLKIAQNGAQFVLTITSDEATQSFNYDYKP